MDFLVGAEASGLAFLWKPSVPSSYVATIQRKVIGRMMERGWGIVKQTERWTKHLVCKLLVGSEV
jgi:hypothetical protein